MARRRTRRIPKAVEALTHEGANRKNIPTVEFQPVMRDEELNPVRVAYERCNRDLDPQLVWRGKDGPTWSRVRQGFVYERVPHVTLKSIANNAEIDVIWEKFQRRWSPCAAC